MPSSQLQAARQVWGQGYMPANPSVPLILGDHGGSWRHGTEATRGHQSPLPSTAMDWAPASTRKHDRVPPQWGVTCPGTEPTWRKAQPLLLETHPQALRATQSHVQSPRGRFMLCLGHERAVRHIHDIIQEAVKERWSWWDRYLSNGQEFRPQGPSTSGTRLKHQTVPSKQRGNEGCSPHLRHWP